MATPKSDCGQSAPDFIVQVIGAFFGMGIVGGSAFHFLKAIYNSPKGARARLINASHAVRTNAPRVGGRLAAWGGLYATIYCTIDDNMSQKDKPTDQIIAVAAASGLLRIRRGLGASARSAGMGGGLMALVLGAEIMVDRSMAEYQHYIFFGNHREPEAATSKTKVAKSGRETKVDGRRSKTEIGAGLLELFD